MRSGGYCVDQALDSIPVDRSGDPLVPRSGEMNTVTGVSPLKLPFTVGGRSEEIGEEDGVLGAVFLDRLVEALYGGYHRVEPRHGCEGASDRFGPDLGRLGAEGFQVSHDVLGGEASVEVVDPSPDYHVFGVEGGYLRVARAGRGRGARIPG